MLTQCYDVTPGKFRRIFVRTFSVDFESVQAQKWNSEMVIIFQSFGFKRSQGVNNYKHICAFILFQLNYWNHGAFDELVKDTFNMVTGYLSIACVIQTEEQRHHTF